MTLASRRARIGAVRGCYLLLSDPSVAAWSSDRSGEPCVMGRGGLAGTGASTSNVEGRARLQGQARRHRGRGSSRSPPVFFFFTRGAFGFETARVSLRIRTLGPTRFSDAAHRNGVASAVERGEQVSTHQGVLRQRMRSNSICWLLYSVENPGISYTIPASGKMFIQYHGRKSFIQDFTSTS